MVKERNVVFTLLVASLFLNTCNDSGNPINGDELPNGEKPPCPPIRIVALAPYSQPVWHPSGQFIAFNHLPLERIEYPYRDSCFGQYVWKFDSAGFWMINADGTDMRRVLPDALGEPVWSPDGTWIAFGAGAQIFKMRFTGATFDTSTLVQLTTEGRNFFPAWSPDGRWIAYDNTDCGNAFEPPPTNSCGILLVRNDGTARRFAVRGRMPTWTIDGNSLVYVGLFSEIYSVDLFDTSQVARLTSFNQVDPFAQYNSSPQCSPDGTKIAFASRPSDGIGNIWVMNADGSNPRQLTTEGTGEWFSWSPDGRKIVYLSYRFTDWTYANGTIWIIDVETGQRRQLTFNHPPQ